MEVILGLAFIFLAVIVVVFFDTRSRQHRETSLSSKIEKKKNLSSTGRTYIDNRGYRRFTSSDYLVHRWVARKKMGRKLGRYEVVHHIDHNKLNNAAENLYVCRNQLEHERIHERDAAKRRAFNR